VFGSSDGSLELHKARNGEWNELDRKQWKDEAEITAGVRNG
jgi:hypothetical protein